MGLPCDHREGEGRQAGQPGPQGVVDPSIGQGAAAQEAAAEIAIGQPHPHGVLPGSGGVGQHGHRLREVGGGDGAEQPVVTAVGRHQGLEGRVGQVARGGLGLGEGTQPAPRHDPHRSQQVAVLHDPVAADHQIGPAVAVDEADGHRLAGLGAAQPRSQRRDGGGSAGAAASPQDAHYALVAVVVVFLGSAGDDLVAAVAVEVG